MHTSSDICGFFCRFPLSLAVDLPSRYLIHLILGARHLVPETRSMVPEIPEVVGIRGQEFTHQVPDTRYLVPETYIMLPSQYQQAERQ